MSEELQRRLDALSGKLYSMAGGSFNLNSPKQLRRVLFDELGLPRGKRTKTGYSTDTEVLSKLALIHPFPKSLLEYREVFKLKSTYVDAIPKLIDSSTGRVHTSFNQTVTSTGRLSSSNPNLQNIPVRSEVGRRIRKGFVAPAGSLILSADYSQIELRILAHLSEDQTLIDAFNSGQDIHSRTAALVFGIPEPQITAEHRRKAKVVNFGIVYGMSPYGLAKELGISPDDAATFIEEYFAVFPGVKSWIDETIERAREDGFVKTMLNRVRHLPDINSRNRSRREFQERTAVNTPIQGTAADLMKMAMIGVHKSLSGLGTKLILQIHDELVLEVPQKEMTTAKTIVEKEMASPLPLKVPVAVEVGTGRNWYEAH
jgi:DNA polymerase-1